MQKILVVVDMQNDFIDGALGTKEAVAIVPAVKEKIKNFEGRIIFTRDTHEENYMDTQEGKNLPVPHCIIGTKGWEIREELMELCKEEPINKVTFGSIELGIILKTANEQEPIESITFIGLCTDICVISNAMILKASFPEVPIKVMSNYCAGTSKENHFNALKAMEQCHIEVI